MNKKQEQESVDTLASMIDLLGLTADLEASSSEKAIILNLKSEDPGRIIGRNGQTIDAMQLLMNKMLRRSEDRFPPIVLDVEGYKKAKKERRGARRRQAPKAEKPTEQVEAGEEQQERQPRKRPQRQRGNKPRGGNRQPQQSRLSEEREEAIKKQAVEASKEVKRWGEKVILPPMSSAERRIVHLALQHDPEVETESGDTSQNGKKRVVVRSR